MEAIRQGDVMLVRVGQLSANRQEHPADNGRIVVEYGEVTGHAHVLDRNDVLAYDIVSEAGVIVGQEFLVLTETPLRHDEHAPITLTPGVWERWYQVEDDGAEERRVLD